MKTILLENDGLLSKDTKKWVNSFDKNFVEINSSIRDYNRNHDLWFFAILIDKDLDMIFTSSAFQRNMDHYAHKIFNRNVFNDDRFKQIEYFSWLIREAVLYREKHSIQPLNIFINYLGDDFLDDLKSEELGKDTKTYIKLMLRQCEGSVIINIYKDYEFQYTLKNEDDLKF